MAIHWTDLVYKSMVLGHACIVLGAPREFDGLVIELRAALVDPESPDASGSIHPMRAAIVRFTDLTGPNWMEHAKQLIADLRSHEVLIVLLDTLYRGGWAYSFFKALGDEYSGMGGISLPNGVYLPENTPRPRGTAVITSSDILQALAPQDQDMLMELYSTVEAKARSSSSSVLRQTRPSASTTLPSADGSSMNDSARQPACSSGRRRTGRSMVSGVSNEAVEAFDKRFDACLERVGDGKVRINTIALRVLVREEPKTAIRVTELFCLQGESNAVYFQRAMALATAYRVEFQDDSLMELVEECAEGDAGEEALARIETAETTIPAEKAKEARKRAIDWWRSTNRQEGKCDHCATEINRGEGYLVRGPMFQFDTPDGPRTIDTGEEIICEQCWQRTRGGTRWH